MYDSAAGIVTRLRAGGFEVRIPVEAKDSLFPKTSSSAVGPIQTPINGPRQLHTWRVKRTGLETNHLPPSSVEVHNEWSYALLHPFVFSFCVDRDDVTFTFYPCILHFTLTNLSFKHYIEIKIKLTINYLSLLPLTVPFYVNIQSALSLSNFEFYVFHPEVLVK